MLATFQFAGKLISRSLMHPGVSYSSSGLQSSSTLAQYGFELKKWRCSCIPANPKTLGGFEKLLADKIHRVLGLSRCISSWSESRYALNLCSDTWMIDAIRITGCSGLVLWSTSFAASGLHLWQDACPQSYMASLTTAANMWSLGCGKEADDAVNRSQRNDQLYVVYAA